MTQKRARKAPRERAADSIEDLLGEWRRERPDLDPSPMGLIGRLHRLGDRLNAELRPVFAGAGLGDGDFDVLASLRRAGAPYELTPGELCATTMVTSSAVTKRIDRLERAGLVTRSVSEQDARSRRVRLTDRGFDVIDRKGHHGRTVNHTETTNN